jgi:hypothetical protein
VDGRFGSEAPDYWLICLTIDTIDAIDDTVCWPQEKEAVISRLTEHPHRDATPATPSIGPLTRDFLAWVASRPRSYTETMEAWRSSCPRFTVWEDAIGDDLVRVESGGSTMGDAEVVLTPRGRALLDNA